MSLYNRIFGENEDAKILLGMISCSREIFMRYRDVYLNPEGNIITVLTRLGGPNRRDYKEVFNQIKTNPYYLKDYDDNFDKTYCYIEFKVPDKYKNTAKIMAPEKPELTVKQKFDKEMEEAAKDPNSPAAKRMDKLREEIFGGSMSSGQPGIHIIGL